MGNSIPHAQQKKNIHHIGEDQYIGNYINGAREGYGINISPNEDKYEGEWLNDMKHGKGAFYYHNGDLYIGDWEFDQKSGKGMYFYNQGDRFDGEWKNNTKNGEGTYYERDGTITHGYFKNAQLDGKGETTMPDGTKYERVWEEGELIIENVIDEPESGDEETPKKGSGKSTDFVETSSKASHVPFPMQVKGSPMVWRHVGDDVNENPLSKDIHQWGSQDICNWLDRGGFSQYKDNFIMNHITGRNLFDLTEEDLKDDLAISNFFHRKRLIKDILFLKAIFAKGSYESEYVHNMMQRVYKKSQQESRISNASLHSTESRSITLDYKESDGDLLQTAEKTLGKTWLINYFELEIGESIGQGGYGQVFQGKWLGQDVAIKMYGKDKVRDKEKIDIEFLKEAEVLNHLRHPNIVLFMGVSITPEDKGLLVTELLEGGTLYDHIHLKNTNFDDNQTVNIALGIALGMQYLHGQQILHCDLKSPNILLDDNLHVRLADFGLSKYRNKKKDCRIIGTPHWMAPEIMREESYDEYSDVYSYGMILWEILAKELPYADLQSNQILGAVGYGGKQVPIPETNNEILLALMKKCIAKERKERPNFKEIVEYLKDVDKHRKLIAMRELEVFFN